MSLASISIKRPTFLTCVILLMLTVGYLSMRKLPVDLFPDVTLPIVTVTSVYTGAGPQEIETQVSKIIEDEISNLPGIKSLRSVSREGVSSVAVEFSLETDIKDAEQQVRARVSAARRKLPDEVKEPTIRRISPSDQPIILLSLSADLPAAELYDLADQVIRPKIEQVNEVGLVTVVGGRQREIHVSLDQDKLRNYQLSASMVAGRLGAAGQNIPIGTKDRGEKSIVFRTLGEFTSVQEIQDTIVNFMGNDVPVTLKQIGNVKDSLVDETNRSYLNGQSTLVLFIFRQSSANTIAVSKGVEKRVQELQKQMDSLAGSPKLTIVRTAAKMVEANVHDVQESILIGIALTIVVVFFFLGSGRSTIITGLALPNSLLGAFILMAWAGFTINVMSLLALSLCVGLLVDDAIVVRENIFRHKTMGKSAMQAALDGTSEVTLAVIATTMTVVAVFGPIGFLKGVVGQFFKQFGLTICFAMLVSLFDALTIAPMMSAYFGGGHDRPQNILYRSTIGLMLDAFEKFQVFLEKAYDLILRFTLRKPIVILLSALGIFVGSIYLMKFIPKTFLSPQDNGEFAISLDMPPGTSLEAMNKISREVDEVVRGHHEVKDSLLTVGNRDGQSNVAEFFITLVPREQRSYNTSEMKDVFRKELERFSFANPIVKDLDMVGGGMRPFNVNIVGSDLPTLEKIATAAFAKLKNHPGLKDVDISHRPGKPEVQFIIDRNKAEKLGVSTTTAGLELRNLVEGATPAIFRQNAREYDIRVRLDEDQRDIAKNFDKTFVPNINNRLLKLGSVAEMKETTGPATINRQDRGRYIQIGADVAPNGPGLGAVMEDIRKLFSEEIKLPEGYRYVFVGQAESFQELIQNMTIALILSILFIFFVLASLYESFVTPLTIMLVLPLAMCGAFFGLFVTGKALDLNSMIGCILLLGIATKNSILLVDYANQQVAAGADRKAAILAAGRTRLRPILMTTVALIAGMLPIAIGLNEASKQRTTMGIAVIGGLISSTILSLLVVPASYAYMDRFRVWSANILRRIFVTK